MKLKQKQYVPFCFQDQQRVLRSRRRHQLHPAGQTHEGMSENPGQTYFLASI